MLLHSVKCRYSKLFISLAQFHSVLTVSRDQAIGALMIVASVIVIVAYLWLLFFPFAPGVDMIVLKLTGAVAIIGVFGILAWIGYTLATTPPPKPIEEIEKEIEEELKKLEQEEQKESGTETQSAPTPQ